MPSTRLARYAAVISNDSNNSLRSFSGWLAIGTSLTRIRRALTLSAAVSAPLTGSNRTLPSRTRSTKLATFRMPSRLICHEVLRWRSWLCRARHQADGAASGRRITDLRQAPVQRVTESRLSGLVQAGRCRRRRQRAPGRRGATTPRAAPRQRQRPVDARGNRRLDGLDVLVIQPGIDQGQQVDLGILADRAHQVPPACPCP